MKDVRVKQLADALISYSIDVQKDECVLIDAMDMSHEIIDELVQAVNAKGGHAFIKTSSSKAMRALYLHGSLKTFELMTETDLDFMKRMQGYIALRNYDNSFEFCDVPAEKMTKIRKILRPVIDWRVNKTKWCVLRWPSSSMAQAASMSTEAFEDFYFKVCNMDYRRMRESAKALVELMQKTDKVQLVGPGETNLTFSIKNIPILAATGENNIPDGEVFTAPVRDSANGVICYNTPTVYDGKKYENIRLLFEKGRIVEATASDTAAINSIFDTDEGARYVGEFAIGLNPHITDGMCDILFDEKISGSIHFTPGSSYDHASNGNHSNIHWDLVMIQTPKYGGGKIYFDDVLIRDNGLFVIDALKPLNP
jgi:aminopeptidase